MARDPLTRYEDAAEGYNLATALGRTGRANRAQKEMDKLLGKNPDMDISGLDIEDFSDWKDLGTGTASNAIKYLSRSRKKGLKKSGVKDIGKAFNRWKIGLEKDLEGQMKRGLTDEMDPTFENLQDTAEQNVNSAAISATDEAAIRSRLAAQVRTAQSENLNSVAGALGLGNMENSPAAAALASRAAEEYDQALVGGLRDTSLKVNEINREQQRQDLDLATRIASARFNMLNGDAPSLISMRGDIASMIDALYSRDVAIDLQRQALDDANDESMMDKIGGFANIANSLVSTASKAYTGFGGGGAATTAPGPAGTPYNLNGPTQYANYGANSWE